MHTLLKVPMLICYWKSEEGHESNLNLLSEIRTMIPGYEKIGGGSLGGSKGLFNAIFYDAVRFFPSEEGTFWFSDKPDIPGSRGWGNILPRTCTWARLIEKKSGQAFYFYNVHLDHIPQRSRKNSVVF